MDKVIICNMALARIGHDAIELIDEPSEDARLCRRFYDQAVRPRCAGGLGRSRCVVVSLLS